MKDLTVRFTFPTVMSAKGRFELFLVEVIRAIICPIPRLRQITDLLATDKSRYLVNNILITLLLEHWRNTVFQPFALFLDPCPTRRIEVSPNI